jgi:hypothetical protein
MRFRVIVPILPSGEFWGPCSKWCWDNIENPTAWAYHGAGEFSFDHEQDAVMFALRWS